MTFAHLSLRLTRTLGVAGSVPPFSRVTGEAVAVAIAVGTCPDAAVPSVRGLMLIAPLKAGIEDASLAGLGGAKEKPDAEGKIEEVEEAALKEKREEAEGRLNERPEEEEAAGAAGAAGGAEEEAGVMEGIWNGEKTGGGGLEVAGA